MYWGVDYSGDDLTFTQSMYAATQHAANQWSSYMPFSISQNFTNAEIICRYGTVESIYSDYAIVIPIVDNKYPAGYAPLGEIAQGSIAVFHNNVERTLRAYAENPKYMYVLINSSYSLDTFKEIVTHEMGHILGWWNHSIIDTDLMDDMFTPTSPITALTTNDVNHIKQIYEMLN